MTKEITEFTIWFDQVEHHSKTDPLDDCGMSDWMELYDNGMTPKEAIDHVANTLV